MATTVRTHKQSFIDAPNAYLINVVTNDQILEFEVHTDHRGEGLWIDGLQVLGTAQFSVGKDPAAAYRRHFKKVYEDDHA